MAVKVTDLLGSQLDALRYEPTAKRLRASVGNNLVADTYDGLVVWQPGRVVPTYAIPAQDFSAELRPPDTNAYDVVTESTTLSAAAFRPDEPTWRTTCCSTLHS